MRQPADADQLASLLNAGEGHPDVRETHISVVGLTAESAYKRLKPVRFDFLDFSTREGRYAHLAAEARLNRRLAPDVYRGLVPIWRDSGRWRLEGTGPPADWLLAMRRLPEKETLEATLRAGRLDEDRIDHELGRVLDSLTAFFRSAARSEAIAANGDPAVFRTNLTENHRVLAGGSEEEAIDPAAVRRLRSAQLQALERLDDELRSRQRDGWVRDGHGDLRAEHVYLTEPVRVVDCIAFNHRLRWIDTADDLAFLATDLVRLLGPVWATRLTDGYRERMNDPVSDRLAAFYRSYRFAVRAKVAVLRAGEQTGETRASSLRSAERLIAWATGELPDRRPWLVAVCGLSGAGKTTVAAALAERIGAVHVSSDRVRKELYGLEPTGRGEAASLYSPAANEATYRELLSRAAGFLAEGTGVILDATFLRRADREAVLSLGGRTGVRPLFVECRCPEELAAERIALRAARGDDASDATLDVRQAQRRIADGYAGLPPADHLVVETDRPTAATLDEIVSRLKGR
ncbi:MAG TPA: AAA family ATPase [Planctomycetaceae bacterium]